MNENFIAKASIAINASRQTVWQALMSPGAIKEYMFGAHVDSDWREGSPISWKGEWQGKSYEDKGTILQVRPERFELAGNGTETEVMLAQDHNATEAARMHSEKNWKIMLEGLKKYVEK